MLGRVCAELATRQVSHALIGAAALATHGVSRSTHDIDLLTVEADCLAPEFWSNLRRQGVEVDARRGDAVDPLAGVVRFNAPGERPVDLVVGKGPWQRLALGRSLAGEFIGIALPVLRAADLILLKLFAGGPQDAWDVTQLLAAGDRERLVAEVEEHLRDLPSRCATLWQQIR
ncbi:MAG TPA: hypothetical protein VHR45_01975 [Thermoanaerobaculia bacterium]|nr:hypothetical protein [Thermoanaerobaculia bacterium]